MALFNITNSNNIYSQGLTVAVRSTQDVDSTPQDTISFKIVNSSVAYIVFDQRSSQFLNTFIYLLPKNFRITIVNATRTSVASFLVTDLEATGVDDNYRAIVSNNTYGFSFYAEDEVSLLYHVSAINTSELVNDGDDGESRYVELDEMLASNVAFDDSVSELGVSTAQEAIDLLESRSNGGLTQGFYKFDSDVTASDPGTGNLRFNKTTLPDVTEIYFHKETIEGTDATFYFQGLKVDDRMLVQRRDDAGQFISVTLTAVPVDNGNWWTVYVAIDDSGVPIENKKEVAVAVRYINQVLTKTSEFINDGESGTSRFVEEEEVKLLEPTSDIRLIPSYMLPSSTQDVVIEAKEININTTVSFSVGTINSQEVFLNNFGALAIRVNYTTTATEETIDVTLNNGIETVFNDSFGVVNGTLYILTSDDWIDTSGFPIIEDGLISTDTFNNEIYAKNNRVFSYLNDWDLKVSFNAINGVSTVPGYLYYGNAGFVLRGKTDDSVWYNINFYNAATNTSIYYKSFETSTGYAYGIGANASEKWEEIQNRVIVFKMRSGVLSLHLGSANIVFPSVVTQDLELSVTTRQHGYNNLSYTDLSTAGTPEEYDDNYATKEYVNELVKDTYTSDNIVTGTYEVDWNKETHDLVLTGDTTFTETNLPASSVATKVITIYMTGDFIPTFPTDWTTNLSGEYDGTVLNQIVIEFIKTGVYWVTINQAG